MKESYVFALGVITFAPMVVVILAAYRAYRRDRKPTLPTLVTGKKYLIKHSSEGWIEAVYFGLDMNGYRSFINIEHNLGMRYRNYDMRSLFSGNVKAIANAPLKEREFDKRSQSNERRTL